MFQASNLAKLNNQLKKFRSTTDLKLSTDIQNNGGALN